MLHFQAVGAAVSSPPIGVGTAGWDPSPPALTQHGASLGMSVVPH